MQLPNGSRIMVMRLLAAQEVMVLSIREMKQIHRIMFTEIQIPVKKNKYLIKK